MDRQEDLEKRYISALSKIYKDTKKVRRLAIDRKAKLMRRWGFVMKELLKSTPMYVEE